MREVPPSSTGEGSQGHPEGHGPWELGDLSAPPYSQEESCLFPADGVCVLNVFILGRLGLSCFLRLGLALDFECWSALGYVNFVCPRAKLFFLDVFYHHVPAVALIPKTLSSERSRSWEPVQLHQACEDGPRPALRPLGLGVQ